MFYFCLLTTTSLLVDVILDSFAKKEVMESWHWKNTELEGRKGDQGLEKPKEGMILRAYAALQGKVSRKKKNRISIWEQVCRKNRVCRMLASVL